MILVLIRHGQTPSNVLGLLDTAPPGPGLTDLGIEQAAALPGILDAEPIEAVYASTAARAQQTALPIARRRGLAVTIRHDLREVAAGEREMLGDPVSVRGYLDTIGGWMAGRLDDRTPGPNGESGAQVLERFDGVVREVVESGVAGAVLVAHGAINRFWASTRALNLDNGFGAVNALRNTGIVVLSGDLQQGWTAHSWTDAEVGTESLVSAGPATPDEDPFDEPIQLPDHA